MSQDPKSNKNERKLLLLRARMLLEIFKLFLSFFIVEWDKNMHVLDRGRSKDRSTNADVDGKYIMATVKYFFSKLLVRRNWAEIKMAAAMCGKCHAGHGQARLFSTIANRFNGFLSNEI